MIDVEFKELNQKYDTVIEIGFWLEENMPNPPEPEPQRWSLGYSVDGRVGFKFANDADATHFLLRWG